MSPIYSEKYVAAMITYFSQQIKGIPLGINSGILLI